MTSSEKRFKIEKKEEYVEYISNLDKKITLSSSIAGLCGMGSYMLVNYGLMLDSDMVFPMIGVGTVFGVGASFAFKRMMEQITEKSRLKAIISDINLELGITDDLDEDLDAKEGWGFIKKL